MLGFTRILVTLGILGVLVPLNAADPKPDKKKSQAAMLRAQKAAEAGRRDDALAAYAEAIQADPSNTAAMRARGKLHLAAGDREKALADLDEVIQAQPGEALSYSA